MSWIDDLYQAGLGRTGTPAEIAYWQGQYGAGVPRADIEAVFQQTPDWQINASMKDLLGRPLSEAERQHYVPAYDDLGRSGVRRDIMRGSEYQNRLLGDPVNVQQSMARQATAGINSMPGVFNDYGSPEMGRAAYANELLRGNVGPAGQTVPSAIEMLIGVANPSNAKADTGGASKDLTALYQELLGRDPDPTGISGYAGKDLAWIRQDIMNSPEYLARQAQMAAASAASNGGAQQSNPWQIKSNALVYDPASAMPR